MKNLFNSTLLASAAIAALIAALVAGPPTSADATEHRVVLSKSFTGDVEALTATLQRFFVDKVGPGDTFSLWDGPTNKRVNEIAVPNDDRYTVAKRKVRKFAREVSAFGPFIQKRASTSGSSSGEMDTLSVLRGVGDNRIDRNEDIHVLMIGSPIQITRDAAWSMRDEDGALRVPTDAALLTPASSTPYSVAGREDTLSRVYVHMCTVGGPSLNQREDMALRHVWGQWTSHQSGALVTWADDLSVCIDRFSASITEPIDTGAPDRSLPPAMLNPGWTTHEIAGKAEVSQEITRGKEPVQPDVFNIFFKANHPKMRGLIVFTGVEYASSLFPIRFTHKWCYFNSAAGQDGVQVRIDVAKKAYGKAPVWDSPTDKELKAAGVTREDFDLARTVCQFPTDGGVRP